MDQMFSGPMPLEQEKNCEDIANVRSCRCTHPIQTLQWDIDPTKRYLVHSCLDLKATINSSQSERGHMAFLVANSLTLEQGTLTNLELFSDAVDTAIEGFNTTSLTLVSPGNHVTISDCQFVNADVKIISAENALIKDTSFSGEMRFDEEHE